ncbi:4Fe-4S dicluster domain-containing protein [Candidatus Bathyarchaeota archaeon]|nr:4Fe-4S dicluster domain-containing protein [Candidatus Bathyarchaeota archaeon]
MALVKKILKPFMVVAPKVLRSSQTVAYPDERLVFSPRFRGRHRLHLDRCIHCGTCARVCPCSSILLVEVEGREGKYPRIDYGTCSLCGFCVEFCPTKALEFTDLVEFSSMDRGRLIYTPEMLSHVPDIKEVIPRLKRRIEPYLTESEMKYRKVEEL